MTRILLSVKFMIFLTVKRDSVKMIWNFPGITKEIPGLTISLEVRQHSNYEIYALETLMFLEHN